MTPKPNWPAVICRAIAKHNGPNGRGGVERLALELSVSAATVSRWASGDRNPSGPAQTLLRTLGYV